MPGNTLPSVWSLPQAVPGSGCGLSGAVNPARLAFGLAKTQTAAAGLNLSQQPVIVGQW
jgi:hypothetical protein